MRKECNVRLRRVGAVVLVYVLASSFIGTPVFGTKEAVAATKPKLESSKGTLLTGESKTVTIKNIKEKSIRKLSVTSAKKTVATAKKQGKTSFVIKSKKPGKATVNVTLLLKNKKKFTFKYAATVSDTVDRKVDVLRTDNKAGYTINLRYFAKTPHIPYISAKTFYAKLSETQKLKVIKTSKDKYLLTVPSGIEATVDTKNDVLNTDDLNGFRKIITPIEGEPSKNSDYGGAPYVKPLDDEVLEVAKPFNISFRKYDIDIIGDTNDIWLPIQTASNVFISSYGSTLTYVGNKIYHIPGGLMYDEGYFKDYLATCPDMTRPDDLVEYTYNELCFIMDTVYGNPGRCYFSDAVEKNGLDRALEETDDATRGVRNLLKSKNLEEYIFGLGILQDMFYDGGHTCLDYASACLFKNYTSRLTEIAKGFNYTIKDGSNKKAMRSKAAKTTRGWSDFDYHEKGDTAVFSFDHFTVDQNAWKEYYKNGGEIPNDTYGYFIKYLKKASESKRIKNFVLDLTCNRGGDTNVAAAILGIMSGNSDNYIKAVKTGEMIKCPFLLDKNLDGKFDEKDDEVKYGFNFAVLTSQLSFSCGNYLPFCAKSEGIMILGERSGGGECAINGIPLGDGLYCFLSSDAHFVTKTGEGVEAGAEPDKEIEVKTDAEGKPDYSGFYDIDALSRYINEFYKK